MKTRPVLIVILLLLLSACVSKVSISDREGIPVTITGVHHMGNLFSISTFRVDGYWGGDVGRGGGGGSFVCCAILPRKWRDGLNVEVRWTVSNWADADFVEIEKENYSSIKREGIYKAVVPVEYYEEPDEVFVHFFSKGRVRVVSSAYWPRNVKHPIPYGVYESSLATGGVEIKSITEGMPLDEK